MSAMSSVLLRMNNARFPTGRRCGRDRLIEATQDGLLDPQTVVEMCARWLTSDEVYEMCDHNEINLARLVGD